MAQTATLPSHSAKKNTIQEKQVILPLGNDDGLSPPHQPPVPCSTPTLSFLTPEPFPDPHSQHRGASQWQPGAFSRWPKTKQEEQQLVLLTQQISVQPEFQRSLMKKGRWGQVWVENQ